MDRTDKFFTICMLIGIALMIWANGKDLTHIREHVHEILENQKSAIVAPTPQKDVE